MKKVSKFDTLGSLIFVITYLINRFLVEIPDIIYIPIMVLCIILLILGIISYKKAD